MDIEWVERKRPGNLVKHKPDFRDAVLVLTDNHVLLPGRSAGDEVRTHATGWVRENLVAVISTERGDAIRVISMRRARKDERAAYQALFG